MESENRIQKICTEPILDYEISCMICILEIIDVKKLMFARISSDHIDLMSYCV